MWNPLSVLWLAIITVISYLAGIILSQTDDKRKKTRIVVVSIGSILLILFVFKYLNFVLTQIVNLAGLLGIPKVFGVSTGAGVIMTPGAAGAGATGAATAAGTAAAGTAGAATTAGTAGAATAAGTAAAGTAATTAGAATTTVGVAGAAGTAAAGAGATAGAVAGTVAAAEGATAATGVPTVSEALSASAGVLLAAAPIGISFYTFQALGYIFDVARGKAEAAWDFGKYALSIAFFPHIMQGPIDRSDNLLRQLDEVHAFDYEGFSHGAALFLFGAVKKVLIADRLALLVNSVYGSVGEYSGQAFWVASVFYTFQIYCDFSGYTDMALGSAQMMGFRLPENFRRPYLATSIADFWRRWHISLSNWFRDYIYIPLGGSRVSEARWALNVMIVFLVSGIWHGAAWSFVLWGLLHGLCQVIGRYKSRIIDRIYKSAETPPQAPGQHWLRRLAQPAFLLRCFRTAVTFLIVNLLWILFRVSSLEDLNVIRKGFFRLMPDFSIYKLGVRAEDVNLSIILILFVIVTDIISETVGGYKLLQKLPALVRGALYLAAVFAILLFGVYGSLSADSFIYFQF